MEGEAKRLLALSLPQVTVYASFDSARLRYVLDWLLVERLGLSYRLSHDPAEAAGSPYSIAYGWMPGVASIHAVSLLSENSIDPHEVRTGDWQGLHALYLDDESPCDIQFDLLAGIFYLLTRYEEHLGFTPDKHGRYPTEQSILHPVLERPVVDEWVEALRAFLQQVWNVSIPVPRFSCQPTYDIDIAWSYMYKGWKRSLGAGTLDLSRGSFRRFAQRIRVISRREQDPYNAFVWLASQHLEHGITPLWFFLAALQPSRFDKNIDPRHPRMSALIHAFAQGAPVGLHPSYYSDELQQRLVAEKAVLESVTGKSIRISRQHYIRLRFPATYQHLLKAGITDDYSMGYSTHFGFRAGTGMSFPWYELGAEQAAPLRVHPFAFMDTTGHYDLGLSAGNAFERLYAMAEKLVAANSRLITVFHNSSLGSEPEWEGWRPAYAAFLRRLAELGAFSVAPGSSDLRG